MGGESKLFVDLWEANRRQLLTAGLGAAQIVVVGSVRLVPGMRGDR